MRHWTVDKREQHLKTNRTPWTLNIWYLNYIPTSICKKVKPCSGKRSMSTLRQYRSRFDTIVYYIYLWNTIICIKTLSIRNNLEIDEKKMKNQNDIVIVIATGGRWSGVIAMNKQVANKQTMLLWKYSSIFIKICLFIFSIKNWVLATILIQCNTITNTKINKIQKTVFDRRLYC